MTHAEVAFDGGSTRHAERQMLDGRAMNGANGIVAERAPVPRTGFRPDIQGMRAIAVLAVVLYHAGVPWMSGGYAGVDVFFVISGFLITQHLLSERMRTGGISAARFYARRIRRLLPAAVLVLVATCLLARLLLPPLALFDVRLDALATAAYVPNVLFAARGTDYLSTDAPSVFQHYWSLAVEEQFYLCWPIAILLCGWRAKRYLRNIGILVACVFAVSLTASAVLTQSHQPWAYFTLPTRAWELAVGGAIAVFSAPLAAMMRFALAAAIGWLGLIAIGAACVLYGPQTSFPGVAALLPVLGAGAVLVAGLTMPRRLSAECVLRRGPLQFVGEISYSLYLWHWPLLTLPAMYRVEPLAPLVKTGLVAVAVLAAYATRRWVEIPFVEGRRRPAHWLSGRLRRSYTTAAALTVVALVAALLTPSNLRLSSDERAPVWSRGELVHDVRAPSSVPANLVPSLRAAADDAPEIYGSGCHADFFETTPRGCEFGDPQASSVVVLFGDSHAAQWFPAMQEITSANEQKLITLTKSACPSVDVRVWNPSLHREYFECEEWRASALGLIARVRPAMVIIANSQGHELITDGTNAEEAWAAGLERSLGQLPASARTVVIGDTPMFPIAPSMCLAEHIDDVAACERPAAAVVNQVRAHTEREVAAARGALYVDVTRWTCPDGICAVIMGNVALYRDRHHLTTHFVSRLVPVLELELH